jgi:Cell wall-active antibiotics response 4TMS YvqF
MDDPKVSEKSSGLTGWWAPQPPAPVREELPTTPARGIVSIFSENKKEGRWAVPRHLRVLSVFASVKVDLREAVLQSSVSVIEAIAVFAEVQIIVPPDIAIECDGDAFMGTFTVSNSKRKGGAVGQPPLGAPVVRVIGSAYLGNVVVKIRQR